MSELTVFLHVPKCGGTSLRTAISQNFDPSRVFSSYRYGSARSRVLELGDLLGRGESIQFVMGHLGFGIHACVPAGCRYFTMLRNPVDRVVSYYKHILRGPEHQLYSAVRGMSLKEYVTSGIDGDARNSQTRYLSGAQFYYAMRGDECAVGTGQFASEQAMFEAAAENLNRNILLAGTVERFEESLLLLKNSMGLRNVYFARLNQAKNPDIAIDPSELDVVADNNQYDLALYRQAEALLQQRVAQSPALEQQLSGFCRRNRWVGRVHGYKARILHKIRLRAGAARNLLQE